jgi:hypothetical protein
VLDEGWYLMSVSALERELIRWRTGSGAPGEDIVRLTTEEALAHRNHGNLPDAQGRSLRLVLHVFTQDDLRALESKRRFFEPDYLDAPEWRVAESVPVNVVPLRASDVKGAPQPWWEEPRLGELEAEWSRSGRVAGLEVPGEYRSFIYKTVLALQDSGRPVSEEAVLAAIARWLSPGQVEAIRSAFPR